MAQVVNSVHSSLAGEGPSTGAAQPKEVFTSINLPVDARVPLHLKTKVWQNEFIDVGLLLAPEPVTKPKKIVSIDSW